MQPQWDEEGESLNLAAAAIDALEWLKIMKRFADTDVFRFAKQHNENVERLAAAIASVEKFLA